MLLLKMCVSCKRELDFQAFRASKNLSLDQCIEFIAEDELIEVTPNNIRLRKMELDQNKRLAARKKEKYAESK